MDWDSLSERAPELVVLVGFLLAVFQYLRKKEAAIAAAFKADDQNWTKLLREERDAWKELALELLKALRDEQRKKGR